MLESGLDISPVITHRLPWHAYEQGFAAMRAGEAGKVVLDWQASVNECLRPRRVTSPGWRLARRGGRLRDDLGAATAKRSARTASPSAARRADSRSATVACALTRRVSLLDTNG